MALALRLMAMVALSIMFALVKWLANHGVNIVESLFYRQLMQLPVAFIALLMGPGLAALRTRRIGAHFTRHLPCARQPRKKWTLSWLPLRLRLVRG